MRLQDRTHYRTDLWSKCQTSKTQLTTRHNSQAVKPQALSPQRNIKVKIEKYNNDNCFTYCFIS